MKKQRKIKLLRLIKKLIGTKDKYTQYRYLCTTLGLHSNSLYVQEKNAPYTDLEVCEIRNILQKHNPIYHDQFSEFTKHYLFTGKYSWWKMKPEYENEVFEEKRKYLDVLIKHIRKNEKE